MSTSKIKTRFVDLFVFNHSHLVFEMPEITTPGLIDQCIAVSQKQNAFFCACFPQAMDNLKSGIGFTCASSHGEQDALLTFGNSLNRTVDSYLLVITRASAGAIKKIVLDAYTFSFFRDDTLILFITQPQLFR